MAVIRTKQPYKSQKLTQGLNVWTSLELMCSMYIHRTRKYSTYSVRVSNPVDTVSGHNGSAWEG